MPLAYNNAVVLSPRRDDTAWPYLARTGLLTECGHFLDGSPVNTGTVVPWVAPFGAVRRGSSQLMLEELRAELAVDVGQDGGVQLQLLLGAAGKHVLFLLIGHLGLDGLGGRWLGRGSTPWPVQLASFVGRVVRRAPDGGWTAPAVAVAACALGPRRSTLLEHERRQVALALLAHTFCAPSGT